MGRGFFAIKFIFAFQSSLKMSAKLILKEIGISLFGKDKKDEINRIRQMALLW